MNFGKMGLNTFVGSSSNSEAPQNVYRSGLFYRQSGSASSAEEDWRRFLNVSGADGVLPQRTPSLLRSNAVYVDGQQQQQQMLSFSSPGTTTLPHQTGASGLGSGSFKTNLDGNFVRTRTAFTPKQSLEFETQSLIFKFLHANYRVPSNLVKSITSTLNPSLLSRYPGSSSCWSPFHLGMCGNADPEPGRCRRTDGKKWQCSKNAVGDQKYCERHSNRGRHRSNMSM